MTRADHKAAQQQTADAQAYWSSPIGQAVAARQRGDGFFQIDLPHQLIQGRDRYWTLGNQFTRTEASGPPPRTDLLSAIEAVGWKLEHANFVWVQTGEVHRRRQYMPGSTTAVSGYTVGVYLFRAV